MLGLGVYPLGEAARYAGVPAATVRSWFKPRSDDSGHGPVFRSDFDPVDGDYAVSFLNLIEIHVGRFFREAGVSAAVLRRAHELLAVQLKVEHPFAHADLCTDGRRIIHDTADTIGNPQLIDVVSRQQWFTQVKSRLGRIRYAERTKLAARWNIAEGIVVDPQICFGKPVVKDTGISTFVLAGHFHANRRDAAFVADLYGVTEKDVLNAARFEDDFGTRRRRAA